ncbi:hypothetical protein [Marinobacter arenosus]|uniref:hypothetical protein n=1 Tax=Marinobacter arenosus TaxID=2856822 RepID=UPI001C4A7F5D|nr:hypothetical protein [Marinobacter arenosus]MBW0147060.1 hypothetical protein [Marinobacter arenosus]
MKRLFAALISILALAGCESLPDKQEGAARNVVFLSAQHCLSEFLEDLDKNHYGPCLKITGVEGNPPQVREDGFIELPVATPLTLATSCVYRHADGSPIPQTMETVDYTVTERTFTKAGQRWYLHAHKQARGVIGCEPTLSRSTYPTYETD